MPPANISVRSEFEMIVNLDKHFGHNVRTQMSASGELLKSVFQFSGDSLTDLFYHCCYLCMWWEVSMSPGACGGQKRKSDPWSLELQEAVSLQAWSLLTERSVHTCNQWVIYLPRPTETHRMFMLTNYRYVTTCVTFILKKTIVPMICFPSMQKLVNRRLMGYTSQEREIQN